MRTLYRRILHRVLLIFFDLLYNSFAWSYDLVAWTVSLGNWRNWVSQVADDLPGPEVLELGHGPGHLQVILTERGISTTGIDLSPQMGRIASRRLRKLHADLRLVQCQAEKLPFQGEAFHQVTATFPSEYIFNPQTLAEVYRVLIPGGSLIILPVAWITGKNWLERLASWLFKITGQSRPPDSKTLSSFEKSAFKLTPKRMQGGNWEVLILRAEKPPVPTREI